MTYVMADIHGHRARFDAMLAQINLQPEDKLYILGDVIDRNSAGLSILNQLMQMPNATLLLGNHEYMMRNALGSEDPEAMELWHFNGGGVTHRRWHRASPNSKRIIMRYLRSLPVNVSIQVNGRDYLLVHGAPRVCWQEETMDYKNSTEYAVWERMDPETEYVKDATIIFGHTPTSYYQDCSPMEIWEGRNRIGIDCGCAYDTGRLACLRLEDGKVFYAK